MTDAVFRAAGGARSFIVLAVFAALCLPPREAFGAAQVLDAVMAGARETPPNASAATGLCTVTVDPNTLQVSLSGTFAGLAAPASAAALRGLATAGSVAPVLLPSSTLTPAATGTFGASATLTPAQVAGLLAGQTYCEVADAAFPAGEIRNQVTFPAVAPAMPPWGIVVLAGLFVFASIALTGARATRARHGAGEV